MKSGLKVKDLYDYISNEKDIQIELNNRDGSKCILYEGLMQNLPYCYSEEVLWEEAIEVNVNGLIKISVGYEPYTTSNKTVIKKKEEFNDLDEKETLLKLTKLIYHLDSSISHDDDSYNYENGFKQVLEYAESRLGKLLYDDFYEENR